jgi:hypothetical protein
MYTTAGTAERTFVSKYIEPGVHRVRIAGIEGVDSETGASYVQITFEDADEKTAQIRFYMSERAIARSIQKIKHLATKMVTEEKIDAIEADNLEDYGSALDTLLGGKSCRVKFTGEEVDGIAEATKEGAEYDPVSDEDTKLVLDKTNKYDWKPLPTADVEISDEEVEEAAEDDAPF